MAQPQSKNLFADKAVIGMVHAGAMPGTPHASEDIEAIAERASEESAQLRRAGFDAIIVENMHDRPYLLRDVGPEIVAGMTRVTLAVRQAAQCPVGVQILAGANRAALAVALAAGAEFIRAEGYVFAHVADEGLMHTADAAELLRYRRMIGAEHVAILADVKKKHASHALTADLDIGETARAAEFFDADGVIVTGIATGRPARPDEVRAVRDAVSRPVFIGSGLTPDNLREFWPVADGFIIGSYIKRDGLWSNPLDPKRIESWFSAVSALRAQPKH